MWELTLVLVNCFKPVPRMVTCLFRFGTVWLTSISWRDFVQAFQTWRNELDVCDTRKREEQFTLFAVLCLSSKNVCFAKKSPNKYIMKSELVPSLSDFTNLLNYTEFWVKHGYSFKSQLSELIESFNIRKSRLFAPFFILSLSLCLCLFYWGPTTYSFNKAFSGLLEACNMPKKFIYRGFMASTQECRIKMALRDIRGKKGSLEQRCNLLRKVSHQIATTPWSWEGRVIFQPISVLANQPVLVKMSHSFASQISCLLGAGNWGSTKKRV